MDMFIEGKDIYNIIDEMQDNHDHAIKGILDKTTGWDIQYGKDLDHTDMIESLINNGHKDFNLCLGVTLRWNVNEAVSVLEVELTRVGDIGDEEITDVTNFIQNLISKYQCMLKTRGFKLPGIEF